MDKEMFHRIFELNIMPDDKNTLQALEEVILRGLLREINKWALTLFQVELCEIALGRQHR